jgi:hypothetical protein
VTGGKPGGVLTWTKSQVLQKFRVLQNFRSYKFCRNCSAMYGKKMQQERFISTTWVLALRSLAVAGGVRLLCPAT